MTNASLGPLQPVLSVLLWSQLTLLVVHDTVPLGRWNNLRNFRHAVPLRRRLIGTAVNTATGILALVLYYMDLKPVMPSPFTGLIVVQALLFLGELKSWWWPWLVGTDAATVAHLRPNWEGTIGLLPERHGLSINAMHMLLHAFTLGALLLAVFEHLSTG